MVKRRIMRAFALLLLISGLAALTSCGLKKEPVLIVSLLYEQASVGMNPDGSRFDPYSILNEDILKKVSNQTGVSANELESVLAVDYAGSVDRVFTDFTVVWKGGITSKTEEVLECVGKTFQAFMKDTYQKKDVVFRSEIPKDADLLQQMDAMNIMATARSKYLGELAVGNKLYQDHQQMFQNLSAVAIPSFRNLVIQKGMANDAEGIKNTLKYQNLLLERQRSEAEDQYENRLQAIRLYDATLFPTTSVPSVLNGEYYISTTKTGLDDIYLDAKFFLDSSLGITNTITENEYIVDRLTNKKPDSDLQHEQKALTDQFVAITNAGLADVLAENELQQEFVAYRLENQ